MSTPPDHAAHRLSIAPMMPPVPDSLGKPKDPQVLADESAIRDLVYMFSDAATRGDQGLFRALWSTDDPVWTINEPLPAHWVGIEAIVGGFHLRRFEQSKDFVQSVAGVVVTVDGDTATSWAIIHELGNPSHGGGYENWAYYLDRLVWTPDGWRFKRRDNIYLYVDIKPAPGSFYPPPVSKEPGGEA